MSKYKKILLFFTTVLIALCFSIHVNAQEFTASNLDSEGKVDNNKGYSEDGQDYYSVKGKADKKQKIYILADLDGNNPKHYSIISSIKANKNGNYSTYLASIDSEESVYYLSTDKNLGNKKKDATFDIESINSKIKVIIPPTKGTEIKEPSAYKNVEYANISKETKKYKNEDLTFSGKILQMVDDSSALLSVNDNPNDIIYLEFSSLVQKNSSLAEDDPVTVYGKLKGTKTYKTVKNKKEKVPLLYALKVDQTHSDEATQTNSTSEEKSSSSQSSSSSESSKNNSSSSKPKKKVNKQKQVNKDIAAGLKQAKGWARGELDGDGNPTDDGTPEEAWAWTNYIDKIEYSSDKSGDDKKLYIHVYKGFLNLSKKERSSIMESAMRFTYSHIQKYYKLDQYEDVHQGISTDVIDDAGVPIGMSRVFRRYDFKWFE